MLNMYHMHQMQKVLNSGTKITHLDARLFLVCLVSTRGMSSLLSVSMSMTSVGSAGGAIIATMRGQRLHWRRLLLWADYATACCS
jgi:hypothetical protein